MTDVTQYLLRWDFDQFRDQISDVSASYTKFGASIRELVGAASTDLSLLQQKAAQVTTTLAAMNPELEKSLHGIRESTGSVNQLMESIAQNSTKISGDVSRMAASGASSKGVGGPELEKARSQVTIILEGAAFANASVELAQSNAGEVIRVVQDADKKSADDVTRIQKYLQSEMNAAASRVKEVAGHVPGGVLTSGLIGGALGAMILGVTEKDRKKAQFGEMLNVVEATGEALTSEASRKAVGWFSSFQETAQWFYGIAKEETQQVVKALVDAGYRSKDIIASFDSSLKFVGQNVGIATIALDKHFNLDTGTSMTNVIKITTALGESLQSATDKYIKLGFAGQRSAMGISKFTDAVISGASAMQQYGVDIEDVADLMGKIQKHYEAMGLSPQYAGAQATQVVNGISQGMASMSPSMKAVLAQQMFPELTALDALQKWEDGFKRVAEGGGDTFVTQATVLMRNWAAEGGRSRSQAIRIMEYNGIDNRTAATLYDLGDKLSKTNKLSELTKDEQHRLKTALGVESEKVSDLAKLTRDLTNAVALIGQGLLKILADLVGVIILGIKMLPLQIMAALPGGGADEKAALKKGDAMFDALILSMGSGVSDISKGLKDAAEATGKEFKDDFKPVLDVLGWKVPTQGGADTSYNPFSEVSKANYSELGGVAVEIATDSALRRQMSFQSSMNDLDNMVAASENRVAELQKRMEYLTGGGVMGARRAMQGLPQGAKSEIDSLQQQIDQAKFQLEGDRIIREDGQKNLEEREKEMYRQGKDAPGTTPTPIQVILPAGETAGARINQQENILTSGYAGVTG